jgi:serine/threonine protein kinase
MTHSSDQLSDHQISSVAHDRPLLRSSQGEKQFRTEVDVLSRIRHPNLLGLIGYCADGGERALVYPLMANQSLHTQLHGKRTLLLGALTVST